MAELRILKTGRDDRVDGAILMLEGVIARMRSEGVSGFSYYYSPADGGTFECNSCTSNATALVGALEVQKHTVLLECFEEYD